MKRTILLRGHLRRPGEVGAGPMPPGEFAIHRPTEVEVRDDCRLTAHDGGIRLEWTADGQTHRVSYLWWRVIEIDETFDPPAAPPRDPGKRSP